MKGDRVCQRCGAYIGNYMTGDYFGLLNRKYCDECKKSAELESTRLRVSRFRLEHRQQSKEDRQRLERLEAENEQLRRTVRELRAEVATLRQQSRLTPEQIYAAAQLLKLAGMIEEE